MRSWVYLWLNFLGAASLNRFSIDIGAAAASTCAPKTIVLTAQDSVGNRLIGYNGTVPGPLLKMREGQQVTVEVINDTDALKQLSTETGRDAAAPSPEA